MVLTETPTKQTCPYTHPLKARPLPVTRKQSPRPTEVCQWTEPWSVCTPGVPRKVVGRHPTDTQPVLATCTVSTEVAAARLHLYSRLL